MKTKANFEKTRFACARLQLDSRPFNERRRGPKYCQALVVGIALFSLNYSSALAGTVECTSTIGAQIIDDNLVVPADSGCKLSGTVVNGNVKVQDGGTLTVEDSAVIEGNLKADGALSVTITGSAVNGNLQIKDSDSVVVDESVLDGNVKVKGSGDAEIRDSSINGNVAAKDNSGNVVLIGNNIDGNFNASNNDNPIIAEGNDVSGNTSGEATASELPCPCSADLPSGWAADNASGSAAGMPCPDGPDVTVSETFDNFVGFAGSPFVGTALEGGLSRDCDGFISATCQFTPGGPLRAVSELQFDFCNSTFSAP